MKFLAYTILLVFMASCFGKKPDLTGKEKTVIPSFPILLPDSTTWLNTKDIKEGENFVVFLFGPHCPYSKAEMKDIVDNSKKLNDIQFYVITPYPFNQMKQFYTTYKLNQYPNIHTAIDPNNFFGKYMGAKGVPYLAIYGKDKKLKKVFKGITSVYEIKAATRD